MIALGSGKSSCARTAASLSRCTRWCPFVITTSAKPRARACATAARAPGANTRCASLWPSNAVCAAAPAAATAAATCPPSGEGTCSASARAHSAPRQAPTSTGSGDGSHGVREKSALKSASRRARSTGPAARAPRSESADAAAAVAASSARTSCSLVAHNVSSKSRNTALSPIAAAPARDATVFAGHSDTEENARGRFRFSTFVCDQKHNSSRPSHTSAPPLFLPSPWVSPSPPVTPSRTPSATISSAVSRRTTTPRP